MKNFTLRFEDEELHQDFKIKCIKKNSNMQQELMKMIKEYMNKETEKTK
ncbi:hypothetical protein [Clostridium tetani]|nr:hypothetical protein [Clostridium tetani]